MAAIAGVIAFVKSDDELDEEELDEALDEALDEDEEPDQEEDPCRGYPHGAQHRHVRQEHRGEDELDAQGRLPGQPLRARRRR